MNSKIVFLTFAFLALLITGCGRSTPVLPETSPYASEVCETQEIITTNTIDNHLESWIEQRDAYLAAFGTAAGAPELRYVMPNSWRNLTRLDRETEIQFLYDNTALLDRIVWKGLRRSEFSLLGQNRDIMGTTRVYREIVGNDIFYRLITINSDTQDFSNTWEIEFLQALVYNFRGRLEILAIGSYNSSDFHQHLGAFGLFNSIDIIRSGNQAKGIMGTFVGSPREWWEYILVNGRPWGFNRAMYVLMQDFVEAFERNAAQTWLREEGILLYEGLPYIRIDASNSLIDPDMPLRYTLQNAFDGNPATAFIANTDDGLMEIEFLTWLDAPITGIAIINGYARNFDLYYDHRRIKTIGLKNFRWNESRTFTLLTLESEITLLDSLLTYQIFDVDDFVALSVLDYYAGNRYNNISLAGFNIKTESHGWFFGDIDE